MAVVDGSIRQAQEIRTDAHATSALDTSGSPPNPTPPIDLLSINAQLPKGWRAKMSAKRNMLYYISAGGTRQWEPPPQAPAERNSAEEAAGQEAALGAVAAHRQPDAGVPSGVGHQIDEMLDAWVAAKRKQGFSEADRIKLILQRDHQIDPEVSQHSTKDLRPDIVVALQVHRPDNKKMMANRQDDKKIAAARLSPDDIELIDRWRTARESRDFVLSDRLRERLREKGLVSQNGNTLTTEPARPTTPARDVNRGGTLCFIRHLLE